MTLASLEMAASGPRLLARQAVGQGVAAAFTGIELAGDDAERRPDAVI
jgi:hypothetical protein